jgi:hypothetical protein
MDIRSPPNAQGFFLECFMFMEADQMIVNARN